MPDSISEAELKELLDHLRKYFSDKFEGDYYAEDPALEMLMEAEWFVDQLLERKEGDK